MVTITKAFEINRKKNQTFFDREKGGNGVFTEKYTCSCRDLKYIVTSLL